MGTQLRNVRLAVPIYWHRGGAQIKATSIAECRGAQVFAEGGLKNQSFIANFKQI